MERCAELVDQYLRPAPYIDELISSWFVRICRRNALTPQEFRVQFFGKREIWNVDIDRSFTADELTCVADRLAVNIGGYLSCLLEDEALPPPGVARKRVMLVVGLYHRERKRHGMQFCPVCLKEDREAYLRRAWRNALNLTCGTHEVALQDGCPVCDAPVVPHRSKGCVVSLCHACGSQLASAHTWKVSEEVANYQQAQSRFGDDTDARRKWEGFAHLFWCLAARTSVAGRFESAIRSRDLGAWVAPEESGPMVYQSASGRASRLPIIWLIYNQGEDFIARLLTEALGSAAIMKEFLRGPQYDGAAQALKALLPAPAQRVQCNRRAITMPRANLDVQRVQVGLLNLLRARGGQDR